MRELAVQKASSTSSAARNEGTRAETASETARITAKYVRYTATIAANRRRSSPRVPNPAPIANVVTPRIVAGTSTTASAPAVPSALPKSSDRADTPSAATCRSVPLSRSPATAGNASMMMSRGTSSCSTAAADHSPKRATAALSIAGRLVNSFCLCASSSVVTPVY